MDRALQLSRQALAIVGDNELIHATIGEAYLIYVLWGIKTDEQYLDLAEECAAKVFALNPTSGHGLALRGMIAYKRGHRLEAAALFKRALETSPEYSDSLIWLVSLYARAGKADALRSWLSRLLQIDPLTAFVQSFVGLLAFMEEGLAAGEKFLGPNRRMYEMDPGNPYSRFTYAWTLLMCGQREKATTLLDMLVRDTPDHGFGRLALFTKLALQGDADAARGAVSEELVRWASGDDWSSWLMAEGFALVGETRDALDWLENGVRHGLLNYTGLAHHDPLLEPIRSEPRFGEILATVRAEWELSPDSLCSVAHRNLVSFQTRRPCAADFAVVRRSRLSGACAELQGGRT